MTLKYYRLKYSFLSLLIGVLIALAGCSSGGGGSSDNSGAVQDPIALDLVTLYSTVDSITVHVAYEPNAKPFTGTLANGDQSWSILQNNIKALFLGRMIEPDVIVPQDLAEMDQIPEQGQTSWTTNEVISLARNTWDIPQTNTSAEFYVLLVNGFFNDKGVVNKQVIGVSYNGTSVIAVFKDVITLSGFILSVETIMEQATLVHEFGHSMGLVNLGVPMVSNHEDPEHKSHCTNEDCVMFWENDGSNLIVFIQKIVDSPSDVIFGQECLNDTQSYKP